MIVPNTFLPYLLQVREIFCNFVAESINKHNQNPLIMRKLILLIAAMILMFAGIQTAQAQYGMQVWGGGTYTQFKLNGVDSVKFVKFVQDIQLSAETIELEVGQTYQLNAIALPEDATDRTLEWQSSAIVTVSETGLVKAVFRGTGTIVCHSTDGGGASATCQVTVTKSDSGDPEEHEYVDLGLPNGTLWATYNIGANKPEEHGFHFAWGETTPKEEYNWNNYLYGTSEELAKYNSTDGLTELLPIDDAATANWGSDWQMPSRDQIAELLDENNTTQEWIQLNGVNGWKITSKYNDKTLFIPASGYSSDYLHLDGSSGYYWGRTREVKDNGDDGKAYQIEISTNSIHLSSESRYYGQSIRPVRKK